jgi:hypothetical protein
VAHHGRNLCLALLDRGHLLVCSGVDRLSLLVKLGRIMTLRGLGFEQVQFHELLLVRSQRGDGRIERRAHFWLHVSRARSKQALLHLLGSAVLVLEGGVDLCHVLQYAAMPAKVWICGVAHDVFTRNGSCLPDARGRPAPASMDVMERPDYPMLLQPSLLPEPPRQVQIIDADRELAWLACAHLADDAWAAEQLNPAQRQLVGAVAAMLMHTANDLASLYSVLALTSLNLETVDPRSIDVATFTQARLLQEELAGEELSELNADDLAECAQRIGEAAGIHLPDAREQLSVLHLMLARAVATGRMQDDFMQTYADAMHGSALIDPEELGRLWDGATSDEAKSRLADEYGFASSDECQMVIARYRMAMLNIRGNNPDAS